MNNMVFITNASTKLILRSLRNSILLKKTDLYEEITNDFEGYVPINNLRNYFTPKELLELYMTKMVFKDFKELLNSLKDNKEIVTRFIEEENKKYAQTVKAPSYHTTNGCEWLNKDFTNIAIPKQIQDQALKKQVKEWILSHHNEKFHELNEKFKKEFNCSENLQLVSLKNSGNTNLNNFDTKSIIELLIKSKFQNMDQMLNEQDESKSSIIKRLKYTSLQNFYKAFKGKEDSEEFIIGEKFHLEKDELKKIIYEFYKKKYNNELSFEGSVLDLIGFRACKSCNVHA